MPTCPRCEARPTAEGKSSCDPCLKDRRQRHEQERSTPEGRRANFETTRQWARNNPKKRSATTRRYRQKARQAVLDAYGGKCKCCGEADPRFLTIDHVNGDGRKHRRENNLKGGQAFYIYLRRLKFPPEFQILCFNCNCGRAINGGICPHKELAQPGAVCDNGRYER